MRPRARVFLLLLACTLASPAYGKSRGKLSALFQHATYVYVQAENGDLNSRKITPADRQAISDVQDAIRDWGRYKLTVDRKNAELIIVVRKGRVAEVTPHAGIPPTTAPGPITIPNRRSPGSQDPAESPDAVGVSAEGGPAQDQLSVYSVSPDGGRGGIVWREEDKGGLVHPGVPLFAELRKQIEHAYPSTPPSQPSNP
jgi:hypothetical protein